MSVLHKRISRREERFARGLTGGGRRRLNSVERNGRPVPRPLGIEVVAIIRIPKAGRASKNHAIGGKGGDGIKSHDCRSPEINFLDYRGPPNAESHVPWHVRIPLNEEKRKYTRLGRKGKNLTRRQPDWL